MQHHEITKYLKLPFNFDPESLVHDLETIFNESWLPQIYKMNYEGKWSSLALIAKDGENNTFAYSSSDNDNKETSVLKSCPYFKYVLNEFKCPLISARLLRLNAGAIIKPHRDFKLGYEDHNFRIHIPIITNEEIEFILGGERLTMLPGECWYTNVNFIHSVANRSSEDRVHLVIDGERNEWSDEIFFSLAPKESFNLSDGEYDEETTRRIIEELKNINPQNAEELIKSLEDELGNTTS